MRLGLVAIAFGPGVDLVSRLVDMVGVQAEGPLAAHCKLEPVIYLDVEPGRSFRSDNISEIHPHGGPPSLSSPCCLARVWGAPTTELRSN